MTEQWLVYLDEFVRSLRDGELRRARRWLHGALELDPGNPSLALRMGDLLARLDEPRLAADWLEHAARLADDHGHRSWARQLMVRACAVHGCAVEPAVAYAHLTWERGESGAAAQLLQATFRTAYGAGVPALWGWLTVALPVARQAGSIPLAIDAACAAGELIGREQLCFHLAPGSVASDPSWPLREATLALMELEEDAPGLLWLQGELALAYLAAAGSDEESPYSVRVPPYNLGDPAVLAAGVLPDRAAAPTPLPQTDRRTVRPRGTATPTPGLRSHRPRPWQIPASIEAMRLPAQPVMPRELFAKLPESMRRAVVWLETDRRRANRTQAAVAGAR